MNKTLLNILGVIIIILMVLTCSVTSEIDLSNYYTKNEVQDLINQALSNYSAEQDNLGNHTLSSNLITGSQYLSSDGDNEGISIDPSGNVTISGYLTTDSVGLKFKELSGTTGSTIQTYVNHGISSASKIVSVTAAIYNSSLWFLPHHSNSLNYFEVIYDDTKVILDELGTAVRSQSYKILVVYKE